MAAVVYAFVALSPIAFYALVRSSDFMSAAEVAAFAPGRRYASASAVYFGSAALASILLFARSRHAVWPAVAIVVWIGALQLLRLPTVLQVHDATSLIEAAVLAGFALLAWYLVRLRRRGILQ
jgi:hypothetical protein